MKTELKKDDVKRISILKHDLDKLKKFSRLLELPLLDTLNYIINDYLSDVFLDD